MSEERKHLLELCDLVCSARATSEQIEELESLMLRDEEARTMFSDWSAMQVDLISSVQASQSRDRLLSQISQPPAPHTRGQRLPWFAVLAASLISVAALFGWSGQKSKPPLRDTRQPEFVASPKSESLPTSVKHSGEGSIDGMAIVNRVEEVVWSPTSKLFAQGDLLGATDWVELESGVAEIEFGEGAVVVLEGPAKFAAKSTSKGVLQSGKLAAVVPPWAEGFQIDTPTLEVVDRGTQFVVEVSDDQQVSVGVTKGEVEVQKATASGEVPIGKPKHRLFAGKAVRASSTDLNAAVFNDSWHLLSEQLPTRPDHTQVEVVAKYRRDFIEGISNKPMRENHWRFYANYWSHYNDPEGYRELLWDSERRVYDPNGNVGLASDDRLHVANFSYRGGHPGQGKDQCKDDMDHCVVAAHQVQQGGQYRIESGWLVRAESRDELQNQAVDLRVWVNKRSDLLEQTCNRRGLLKFSTDIGQLEVGDWIYLAVGPRGVAYNDRFEWDFAIVRTIEEFAN